jgi:raffinose/stachyose/melibiose transport system substrate-binding protein
MKFIEFLMRPENVATYIKEQTAVPTLKGVKPSEPALAGLVPYYEQDKVVGFTDHRIPAGIGLDALLQQFLINGNDQAFLKTLDNEWNKVAERQGVAGAETK